jgi:stage V sporulation protein AC
MLVDKGLSEKSAGAYVTVILICLAQLLTGLGVFDTISKFAGAGVIVPITGFANSMVAPAIEYKKEGPVLGIGAKLFSIAGPVLVCGISVSVIIGIISYFMR